MDGKRAELHIHTKFSNDISFIDDIKAFIFAAQNYFGLSAVAFTNLSNVQDFYEIAKAAKHFDVKIIYGAELFYGDDKETNGFRLTALVKNEDGIKPLYKIISALKNNGFCDFADITNIKQNRKNLLIGSAGRDGELFSKISSGCPYEELEKLAVFYDYFEIYPPKDDAERQINKQIVNLGKELGVPVVATSNVHYVHENLAQYRKLVLEKENDFKSAENNNLHLRIYDQMLTEFLYLGQETADEVVYKNPKIIADLIEQVNPIKEGFFHPVFENAFEEIKNICRQKGEEIYGVPLPQEVENRLKTELDLIKANNFADLYLIAQRVAKFVADSGHLVSTRAAAGASLVAYLLGITGVNPIEHNIALESFMGIKGKKQPNFDIVVPNGFRPQVLKFLQELFGKTKVAAAGIVKTYGDSFSNMLVGNNLLSSVKANDAANPTGFMIIPSQMEFEDFTPLNKRKSLATIDSTHFDFHHIMGSVFKLDVIESGDLTLLEKLQKKTKVDPKEIDLTDPKLFKALNYPIITQIPQIDNTFIRILLIELNPKNFDELLKIIGFAHGTNLWLDNGEKLVEKGIHFSLLPAFGEDVIKDLVNVGADIKDAVLISEALRKGLFAKGQAEELKSDFKILADKISDWYFDYCTKIRYISQKAQAVTQVTNTLKLIWFKTYYPKEYESLYHP